MRSLNGERPELDGHDAHMLECRRVADDKAEIARKAITEAMRAADVARQQYLWADMPQAAERWNRVHFHLIKWASA